MTEINGIQDIKANALKIYNGMVYVVPGGETYTFDFIGKTIARIGEKACCMNNSTLAFIVDGEMYAAPYSRAMSIALTRERFHNEYFFVPFSNGDYPQKEQAAWATLREVARKRRREELADDCRVYCQRNQLGGDIDPEVLEKCLEIPASGVSVKHLYFAGTYYPQVQGLDCEGINLVGRYSTNNGVIVFNTNDARTFVSCNWDVLCALQRAGYQQGCLFVPFSNGEEIVSNPAMKIRWETLRHSA